jgi:hypothetical protein
MKITKIVATSLLLAVTVISVCQMVSPMAPVQQQERIITFQIPLSKVTPIIYAIRYTQVMDAKTANELADLLVSQANDTTINKVELPKTQPKAKPKQ